MKKYILIILPLIFGVLAADAQSIKRSVLCGMGGSLNTSTRRVAFTAGQCPGCGTLEGATGYVRQGFQQPPPTSQDTLQPLPECDGIMVEFTIDSVEQGVCGTYYNFTYTGTPDPQLQYLWDFGANAFPSTSTQQNPQNIAYATAGEKTIKLTVFTDSCSEASAKSIEVFNTAFGVDATATANNGNGGPCSTDGTGDIDASNGGGTAPVNYVWSNGATTEDLSDVVFGTYTVTATDANGCTAVQSFVLDANSGTGGAGNLGVSFVYTSENLGVCGTYYNFTYTGEVLPNMTFLWNFGPNSFPSTATVQDPQNIAWATVGNKNVTLTVTTADGCDGSVTQPVQVTGIGFGVNTEPIANGIDPTDPCGGTNTDGKGDITITIGGGTAPYTFVWNNGVTTQNLADVTFGTYTVTATDANACTAVVTTILNGNSGNSNGNGVQITAADTQNECKNDMGYIHLTVNGLGTPFTYDWSNSATTINIDNLNQGIYTVTVTDNNGCTAVGTYTISDFCDDPGGPNGTIPNVFSPNGDNINETFVIDGLDDYPNNEIFIYNRWGELVYSKKSYDNSWDGTHKDKPLPSAAYYYVVNLNDADNNAFTGSITIVR